MFGVITLKSRSIRSAGHSSASALRVDGFFFPRMIPLTPSAVMSRAPGDMTKGFLSVDLRPHLAGTVAGVVLLVEVAERFGQLLIPDGSSCRQSGFKGVIGASGAISVDVCCSARMRGSTPNSSQYVSMNRTAISVGARTPLATKSRGILEDVVGVVGFREFSSQPEVFGFEVDRFSGTFHTGVWVFADSDLQSFLRESQFVRDSGDRPVSSVGLARA